MSILQDEIGQMVDRLNELSARKALDPHVDLDLDRAPPDNELWMPEHLISLYGTSAYGTLTDEQRLRLSQREFCLLCSISCFGEKEVIASIARLMLKREFAPVRSYLYYLIKEENNHIYMFSEFCRRYGELYPSLYSYARGDIWRNSEVDDLMVFVHVLIFEELGQGLNLTLGWARDLPPLVGAINRLHVEDEGRHIAFGRQLVAELTRGILPHLDGETLAAIRGHVRRYLDTLHHDFHNARIYRSVGIADAFDLRTELLSRNDARYFARDPRNASRVVSLIKFLQATGLIEDHPALCMADAAS